MASGDSVKKHLRMVLVQQNPRGSEAHRPACDTHSSLVHTKFGTLTTVPGLSPLLAGLKIDASDPHILAGLTNHHRLIWFSTSSLAGDPAQFITWKEVNRRGTGTRRGNKEEKGQARNVLTRQPIKVRRGIVPETEGEVRGADKPTREVLRAQ